MGRKEIIEELFEICEKQGDFVFNNDLVKKVLVKNGSSTNPYDMTKIDDISKLPKKTSRAKYTVIYYYKFTMGVDYV